MAKDALPNKFHSQMDSENFDGYLHFTKEVMGDYARLKVENSFVRKENGRLKNDPSMEDIFIKFQIWGVMDDSGKMLRFDKENRGDKIWSLSSHLKCLADLENIFKEADLKILKDKAEKVASKREELKATGEYTSTEIFNEIKQYQTSIFLKEDKGGVIFHFRPRKEFYQNEEGNDLVSWVMTNIGMGSAELAKDQMEDLNPEKGSPIIPEELEEESESSSPSSSTPSSSSSPSKSFKREKKKGTVKAPESDLPE